MKINETLEKEIATRLNLTKPIAPKEVSDYAADMEQLADTLDGYHPPRPSWRAKPKEIKETIEETRKMLEVLETITAKVEGASQTVTLATTAHQQALRDYWDKIEREENRPRLAFNKSRDEFIKDMEKESRSLKRKQKLTDWQGEEYKTISTRLELVGYMIDQARYLDYNANTCPAFTELVLWQQIAKSESRANAFLAFVAETKTLAN
jgi:hypothetical protein